MNIHRKGRKGEREKGHRLDDGASIHFEMARDVGICSFAIELKKTKEK